MEIVVGIVLVVLAVILGVGKRLPARRVSTSPLRIDEEPFVPGRYTLHLSGEDRDNRQSTINALSPGEPLLLVREPNNPHDSDAVAVRTRDGRMLGYIPRKNSDWVARLIDDGYELRASLACQFDDDRDGITDVQIHIDDVPGLTESLDRHRRLERKRTRGRGER